MLAQNAVFGSRKDQDFPVSSAHSYTPSTAMSQHGAPVDLQRRSSVSSDRSFNGNTTKTMNRTSKPPSILTQSSSKAPVHPFKNMGAGTPVTAGTGTPTTPISKTPRSGSVRRKPVAMVPVNPTTATTTPTAAPMATPMATPTANTPRASSTVPQVQKPETKIRSDGWPKSDRGHNRTNCDQDLNLNLDDTLAVHINSSQDNYSYNTRSVQGRGIGTSTSPPNSNNSSGEVIPGNGYDTDISRLKRRISLYTPSGNTKNLSICANGRNASSSFTFATNATSPTLSCNASVSGSTMDSHSNGGSSNTQDGQSYYQQSKGANMSQKLADLIGIGSIGSLGSAILGSKKRGNDANTKGTSYAPSPASSMLSIKRGVSGVFDKKETSTSPNGHKTKLLSKMFGSQNHQSQAHSRSGSVVLDSPRRSNSVMRGTGPWGGGDESRVFSWELHNSMPPAGYEDEGFALWIRPNVQARTVISGADVENAEKVSLDEDSANDDEERRKRYRPELEDLKILEEVLDFSIIILMRASASLYPFVASAHSKSIPINIPWRALRYEDRCWKHYNIRTLKEYQDYVMADIGCAIQAMIEIYDQQERPYSHPDNMGRDTKPQVPTKLLPVVLPPNRPRPNMKDSSSGKGARAAQSSATPPTESVSPPKKHRRHSSTPANRPTISGMFTSIKQSLPSPISLHSPQQERSSIDGFSQPLFTSYPDGTPFISAYPTRPTTMSYTRAESMDGQTPLPFQRSGTTTHTTSSGSNNAGGFFPQSIQTILSSIRNNSNGSTQGNHLFQGLSVPPVAPSKQEEKRQQMECRWRVDITRRKAHLRGWACRCFLDLYHFSQATTASLEDEFKDLYRIIRAIVEVDGDANERSHDDLVSTIAAARELEPEPFKLKYSQYKTDAPTAKDIREANEEAAKRFEAEFKGNGAVVPKANPTVKNDNASMNLSLDDCVAPLRPMTSQGSDRLEKGFDGVDHNDPSYQESPSAYDCMEYYGLQGHSIWEPLLDRLTKFDTTHHELDARNIFQFLRRMSLYSPTVSDMQHLLSNEVRDEMLAVLWVLEKCVRERPDYQQSPTWFRLSSSPSAVQAIYSAGGVIPYLKELQERDLSRRDPIQTVHPVTLTGYFKRLLKESGGLLLKEATALFVELARPATDNGDFWSLEKLSRIDRALLYRVICLDLNRGQVFLQISRVLDQILESSPKDMELDAFALSKMVQVVELSGVLDLKALRRWNGAWSAIILGYM